MTRNAKTAPQSHRPAGWADAAVGAAVAALITMSYGLSYAALLFGAAPPPVQARGLFMMLLSVIVLGCVGAGLTRWPFMLVTLEGTPLVVLAGGTTALALSLAGAPPGVLEATIIAGVIVTSVLAGLTMAVLGQWRAAGVARFVPLQVIAGVTAASGVSLVIGGARVAAGHAVSLAAMAAPSDLIHLAPAFGGATVMFLATRWTTRTVMLPALIAAGVALHHAVFAWLGIPLAVQQAQGWLLLAPEHLEPVPPWSHDLLGLTDWTALATQIPTAATVVTIVCLNALVNFSAIELETRRDIDADRDLRAVGIASLVSGLCGGLFGSVSQSRCKLLSSETGGRRAVTMLCAVAAGGLPMLVPHLTGYVPRSVMAALLIYVGIGTLETWILRIRTRLTFVEWLTVPAVVLVTVYFGLPAAVFTGLALGCVTFAAIYSLGNPVRARYRGDVAQSNVARAPAERAALLARPNAVLVMYLQGFLFFGTASRLLRIIRRDIAEHPGGSADRLRHIVLDCSNMDGMDGSAVATFERLLQVTAEQRVTLTLAALPEPVRLRLQESLSASAGLHFLATLDEALERCEDELLAEFEGAPGIARLPLERSEFDSASDFAVFNASLVARGVGPGAVLMTQHERSDDLVFIEAGRANVMLAQAGGGSVRARQFGSGTMIGEIGFLLGTPRTATVRAETACRLLVLTRAAMEVLQAEHPAVALAVQRAMLRRLALRLLDKDHMIEALLRGTTKLA